MQSSLELYYNNEYGNYVTPVAFTMPESSLFLDKSSKSLRVDMNKWLRYELQEVEDWISKMPGTSDFTTKDHNLLFKSSSLLLVFLKIASRSNHHQGRIIFAEDVYFKAGEFYTSGITAEVSSILHYMIQWLGEIKIDPLEFCLLGAVIYAYPFLPDLELPEAVHGAQENGIQNILSYNKLNFTRFSQLCRLLHNLDFVRKLITASPTLMDLTSKWI